MPSEAGIILAESEEDHHEEHMAEMVEDSDEKGEASESDDGLTPMQTLNEMLKAQGGWDGKGPGGDKWNW